MTKEDLVRIVVGASISTEIDPALACAVVSHESSWNPWAVRYEPAFYARYIDSMKNLAPTEKVMRAASFGLFQIMGQTAREFGFDGEYLTELCDPINAIWGCRKLKRCLEMHQQNQMDALLSYNGGNDARYPDAVLAFYDDFAYLNSATRRP